MKKISRNQQKDKRPLAGLIGLKQLLIIPVAVFSLIVTGVNFSIPSTF